MKLFIVLVALFVASSAAPAGPILDLLAPNAFNAALDAFTKNGLADMLKGAGPVTVFVPTDDAFKAFAAQKPAQFKAISENPAMLKKLLANHIVSGLLARKDIKDNQVTRTMAEETVRFNVYGQVITVNGAMLRPEIAASNGIIYPIGRVMMSDKDLNITGILKADPRFSTLYKALEMAGLLAPLDAAGPFTLLAPTDAAFKAVPEAALAKLLATPADLKKLLLSHVLPAAVFRFGAATGDAVTVAGTPVAVTVTGNEMEGALTVGGAKVIEVDIPANNGVIHAIDKILGL